VSKKLKTKETAAEQAERLIKEQHRKSKAEVGDVPRTRVVHSRKNYSRKGRRYEY
jgi:hypothetical protein